jgi:hypothetical protein
MPHSSHHFSGVTKTHLFQQHADTISTLCLGEVSVSKIRAEESADSEQPS